MRDTDASRSGRNEGPFPAEPQPQANSTASIVSVSQQGAYAGFDFTFPRHWDSYLQLVTQKTFIQGFADAQFFDAAVRNATLYLETRIRQLCDAPFALYGTKLMDHAFSNGNPRGQLLTDQLLGAEAEGVHSLFKGAVLHIRNPLGHREVNLRPPEAFDSIAFISYLLRFANEIALDRYVYPFLSRVEKFRGILGTKWADIDGDGHNELVVLIGERDFNATTGGQGRILVLRNDFSDSLPGELPLLDDAFYSPSIAIGDLDGDGCDEILPSLIRDGTLWRHGLVIDFDAGKLSGTDCVDHGEPLRTFQWPFEIIKPMQHKPALIVSYDEVNAVSYLQYSNGAISQVAATI